MRVSRRVPSACGLSAAPSRDRPEASEGPGGKSWGFFVKTRDGFSLASWRGPRKTEKKRGSIKDVLTVAFPHPLSKSHSNDSIFFA